MSTHLLRQIPAVNELLQADALKALGRQHTQGVVVRYVRESLDRLRETLRAGGELPAQEVLVQQIAAEIQRGETPPLRPVINATGVLLHTGLGRAPLADAAIEEMVAVARGYGSVELDLESGRRSQRVVAVERLLTEMTGAEAALVVNNNAGATMITLAALAAEREVIVSRGELIEIGGSFRLPDVMRTSGAILREVGTTNKTHLRDYRHAIHAQTAALLKVHTSNYVVVGFTSAPSLSELVALGRETNLPVIHDIGSGALLDFSQFGLTHEPIAGQSIREGADLVLFSGDKLLGGPQAGIIIGRREYVAPIAAHPMARALRVDKLTLSALAATLRLYRDPAVALAEVPLLRMLAADMDQLRKRAGRLQPRLANAAAVAEATVEEDTAFVGGGSVPTQEIPTCGVALAPSGRSVDELSTLLRIGRPAVIGRVRQDRLFLDLRSVFPEQDDALAEAVESLASAG